jgi:hypothetical protein
LFAIALLLKLAWAEHARINIHEQLPDSELYNAYARTLFEGQPYDVGGNRALRAPGYPAFLAACWTFAGQASRGVVLWMQACLSALTGLIVFLIARRLQPAGLVPGSAFAAMVLTWLEPFGLILSILELSETLFIFLMTASAAALIAWHDRHPVRAGLLAGVLGGLAILTRPSGLVVVPMIAAGSLVLGKSMRRAIAVACLAGLATIAPWIVRNALVMNAFVPTTTNVGESLYDGLNRRATGASNMWFKGIDQDVDRLSERDKDAYFRQSALTWAQENPSRVVGLALIKIARFWSPWPNEPRFQTTSVVLGTTLYTVPFYLSALWGWMSLRGRPAWGLLFLLVILPIVAYVGLHAVFVSSVRYRAVIMPMASLLAAQGVADLVGRRQRPKGGV